MQKLLCPSFQRQFSRLKKERRTFKGITTNWLRNGPDPLKLFILGANISASPMHDLQERLFHNCHFARTWGHPLNVSLRVWAARRNSLLQERRVFDTRRMLNLHAEERQNTDRYRVKIEHADRILRKRRRCICKEIVEWGYGQCFSDTDKKEVFISGENRDSSGWTKRWWEYLGDLPSWRDSG